MRLSNKLSGIALLLLAAVSCVQKPVPAPTVSFKDISVTLASGGETRELEAEISDAASIAVESWTNMHYDTPSDWLLASYVAPKLMISADANTTGKDRSAYVRITVTNSSGSASATLKVVQQSAAGDNPGGGGGGNSGGGDQEEQPSMEFDTRYLSFGAEGGSEVVGFTCSARYLYVAWYEEDLETEADWIDFDETDNEDEIVIVVSPNYGEERVGYFVLFATLEDWDENEDADYDYDIIQITQEGASSTPGDDPEDPAGNGVFTKVTSSSELTDGWYLIVCEAKGVALDGSLGAGLDAQGNTVSVSASAGKIEGSARLANAAFRYGASDGGFRTKDGHYIGWSTADKNGLKMSTTSVPLTVTVSGGDADIRTATSNHLRYNASSGQERFRFFKDASYTNQQAVQLYRASASEKVPEFSVSTTVLSVGPRAGTVSFGITADSSVEWKAASSDSEFCSLNLESGVGSATVKVCVTANTASTPRSAEITVSTANEDVETPSYKITLTQGPASEGDIDDGTPGYDDNLVPRRKIRIL